MKVGQGEIVAFQDLLNYNEHVALLRLSGGEGRKPYTSLARRSSRRSTGKDQHENTVPDGSTGLAGAICKFLEGMAGPSGTSCGACRCSIPSAWILRAGAPRIYSCVR